MDFEIQKNQDNTVDIFFYDECSNYNINLTREDFLLFQLVVNKEEHTT